MTVERRATERIDAFTEVGADASAAMEAVARAWRHQYRDLGCARASSDEAVALATATGDRLALASALFQTSFTAIRLGLAAEASTAADACLALFEQAGDARGIWLGHGLQAICLRLSGKLETAIDRLEALAAAPPAGATPSELFVVHVALSQSHRFLGNLEAALKWHYQAVDTARDSDDPMLLGSTLCNLGGYHSDLYNAEEGCRLLEEGLALTSACDGDRTTVIIALNLSQGYASLGRHDEALAVAERYLTAERYLQSIGGSEKAIPLTLALAYANANRAVDAARVFEGVRHELVLADHASGTPHVFWAYVEARIALVSGSPQRAAEVALATLSTVDEKSVDSPADLMLLHAVTAAACEELGDHRSALHHERCRALIRERLARLASHVAGLTHNIRHELDATRAERDRAIALHAELEREHERLASANRALTAQVAENRRLHEELKEQSFRDALTGLHNRRYLYERGPRLLDDSLENDAPLCLVMLDLDDFKRLNDVYGHVIGDRALVSLGRILRDGLREEDLVCRIGGEEFAMILPATTVAVARDRLDAMLAECRKIRPLDDGGLLSPELTFSAGIVIAPAHGRTIDALMIGADRLLYKAKHLGRARTEIAVDEPLPPAAASPAAREAVGH